ncbi:Ferrihemoglobin_reductase [Hexamita inflata]|uniref:Ferrihemoglobin reductase n=1 Tax=Hexamita inflata TaxID=28002 RepID=A0AA86NDB2_9EUKA|nr:Ferrihemoglobin reductase [Hexamita inflata]
MKFTAEEVSRHCTLDDAWFTYNGLIYDVTQFMHKHPGGIACIVNNLGYDVTSISDNKHRWVKVVELLADCCVGELDGPPMTKADALTVKFD